MSRVRMMVATGFAAILVLAGLPSIPALAQEQAVADAGTRRTVAVGRIDPAPALVLDDDGLPVLGYVTNRKLRIARCIDHECSDANTRRLDTDVSPLTPVSLALDGDGNAVVSYVGIDGIVKIARCANEACTSVSIGSIGAGAQTDLAVDANGLAVVAFVEANETGSWLRLARCHNVACSSSTVTTVDEADPVERDDAPGWEPSLELDASGHPIIGYIGRGERQVAKVAICDSPTCMEPAIETIGDAIFVTMVLDADDRPMFSIAGSASASFYFVRCDDPTCSTNVGNGIDADFDGDWHGGGGALALDRTGLPVMTFELDGGSTSMYRCHDVRCQLLDRQRLGDSSPLNGSPGLVIDAANTPVIATGSFRVLLFNCATPLCTDDFPLVEPGRYYIQHEVSGQFIDGNLNGTLGTSDIPRNDDVWELTRERENGWSLHNVEFDTYLYPTRTVAGGLELRSEPDETGLWTITDNVFGFDNVAFSAPGAREGSTLKYVVAADSLTMSRSVPEARSASFSLIPATEAVDSTPFVGERIALQNSVTDRWLDADQNGNVNQSVRFMADDVWQVADAGDGYVYLINEVTGRYLDADKGTRDVDSSVSPSRDDLWQPMTEDARLVLRNVRFGGYLSATKDPDDFNTVRTSSPGPAAYWDVVILD